MAAMARLSKSRRTGERQSDNLNVSTNVQPATYARAQRLDAWGKQKKICAEERQLLLFLFIFLFLLPSSKLSHLLPTTMFSSFMQVEETSMFVEMDDEQYKAHVAEMRKKDIVVGDGE